MLRLGNPWDVAAAERRKEATLRQMEDDSDPGPPGAQVKGRMPPGMSTLNDMLLKGTDSNQGSVQDEGLKEPVVQPDSFIPVDGAVIGAGKAALLGGKAAMGGMKMLPLVAGAFKEGLPEGQVLERGWQGIRAARDILKRQWPIMAESPEISSAGDALRRAARESAIDARYDQEGKAAKEAQSYWQKVRRGGAGPWSVPGRDPMPFDEQNLPVVNRVKVTTDDGQSHIDWVKGLNRGHADYKARQNWGGYLENPPNGTAANMNPRPGPMDILSDPHADYPGRASTPKTQVETLGSFKYDPSSVHTPSYEEWLADQNRIEQVKQMNTSANFWNMLRSKETEALRDSLK